MPRGLTLNAGNGGTGPGAAAGTVTFTGGTFITATGPAGVTPINIFYNPTSYLTPTDYSGRFTGNAGPVVSRMLVFPDGADNAGPVAANNAAPARIVMLTAFMMADRIHQ